MCIGDHLHFRTVLLPMKQYQLFDQAAIWSLWENVEGENTSLICILIGKGTLSKHINKYKHNGSGNNSYMQTKPGQGDRRHQWGLLFYIEKVFFISAGLRLYKVCPEKAMQGTSLAAQWLGLHASNAGGMDWILGQGTKIPHATWHGKKNHCRWWLRPWN